MMLKTDQTGATLATYAYDNGSTSLTTGQPVSMTRAGQTYFYQYNAHGDVVSLTDSSGNVVNSYDYDPWGKVLSETETVENPYRYAGYRYDSETELYYLQHRYYDPEICRFLTQDLESGSTKEPLSLNSFLYCYNNPIYFVDIDGLRPHGHSKRNKSYSNESVSALISASTSITDTKVPESDKSTKCKRPDAVNLTIDVISLGLDIGSLKYPPVYIAGSVSNIAGTGYTYIQYIHGEAYVLDVYVSGATTIIGICGGPSGSVVMDCVQLGWDSTRYYTGPN